MKILQYLKSGNFYVHLSVLILFSSIFLSYLTYITPQPFSCEPGVIFPTIIPAGIEFVNYHFFIEPTEIYTAKNLLLRECSRKVLFFVFPDAYILSILLFIIGKYKKKKKNHYATGTI